VDAGRLVGRVQGTVERRRAPGALVAGGLDMSQKYDLTALVLTFKEPLDEVQQSST
jgi:phage terminase large subunit-like protein